MKIETTQHALTVTRADSPKVRASGYTGSAEAAFWRRLCAELNRDLSTKDRWYLVRPCTFALTSMPYALRLGINRKSNLMILDNDYAIRLPSEPYNDGRPVSLAVQTVASV